MKLKWEQNIEDRIEGITIIPASQAIEKGVKEIIIYTEYGHSQDGGGATASAEEVLDGKFWEDILSNHSEEVLEEVICTIKVLFEIAESQTRTERLNVTKLFIQHLEQLCKGKMDFIEVNGVNVKTFWQKKGNATNAESKFKVTHNIRILKDKIMVWRVSRDIDANYACVLHLNDFLNDTAVSHRIIKNVFGDITINEVIDCTKKILNLL